MSDITVRTSAAGAVKTVVASAMPQSPDDLRAFDLTDPYQSAAAAICALAVFENDFETGFSMLDHVMGPASPGPFDRDFIKGQLRQYPYVMRAYFEGASVDNDYRPSSCAVTLRDDPYCRPESGYFKLFAVNAGADSPRPLMLRKKGSTGEWFISSDSYKGMMAGIRKPKSDDPWA